MKKINFILIITIVLLTQSCNQNKVRKSLLPGVSGKAGEVLVVIDKDNWDSKTGEKFKDILMQETPGLPQSEPLFRTMHVPHKSFSELFKIHRNIIITTIDTNIKETKLILKYNKWAQPQIVMQIKAANNDDIATYIEKNGEKILSLLLKSERDRLTNNYKKYSEISVMQKLEKKTGVHLTIPKGYTYDLYTTNFSWIAHETPEISQGIFIYYYDYTDSSTFELEYLIKKRNYFLKNYVSAKLPGTYMTTESQIQPTFRSYNYKGEYIAEVRGLWKVHGDFMGGPFVSLTKLDKQNNRVVTIEGFVYAPKYDKRNYMREIEAILYSFEFVKEEQNK